MSSHILAEIEATCNRVLILNKGKIMANGTSAELQSQSSTDKLLKIKIDGENSSDIYDELALIPEIKNIRTQADRQFEIRCERNAEIEKDYFYYMLPKTLVHPGNHPH